MMQSVIGDPDKLLEAFQEHLTDTGGLRSQSIPQLINLMSDTNGKLVPKCISLYIISASDDATQAKICAEGAWDLLLKWLQDALTEGNQSFLVELLTVYLNLPVRMKHLHKNVCPRLINSLAKRSDNKSVRLLASDIVKKWKEVISEENKTDTSTAEPIIKKKKIEIEKKEKSPDHESDSLVKDQRKRRSTVKMPPTNMRTAGIEDSDDQFIPKSRSEILSKKNKHDLVEKQQTGLPIESFHQKITVSPGEMKKVPHELHESSDFMNALTTSQPIVRKKRKLKTECLTTSDIASNVDEHKKSTEKMVVIDQSDISSNSISSDINAPKKSSMTHFSTFVDNKKTQKRVSWAPEDKIQSISYFEVDETERVNVNRVSLAEIRQKELSHERDLFRKYEEIEIKDAKWYNPIPLELNILVDPGTKSIERQVQFERERLVLCAIYHSRESVPVSAEEPKKEDFETKLAVEIPLEDLHSKDVSPEKEDLLIIKDKGDGKSQMSLNPEVANLVKSLVSTFNPISQSSTNGQLSQDPPILSVPSTTSNSLTPIISQSNEKKLLDILEHNYPDVPVRALSPQKINELLAPIQDQLLAQGLPSFDTSVNNTAYITDASYPPPQLPIRLELPPPMQHRMPPPGDLSLPPNFQRHRPNFPPDHPSMLLGYNGRPMIAQSQFRGPPPRMYNGPHMQPNPLRGPPPRRGGRMDQICKFFQQGHCRNGNNCHFLHPGYPSKPGW